MSNMPTAELREISESPAYGPAVSVILPFDPKMTVKTEIMHSLKAVVDKVERELKENYPSDLTVLVTGKLNSIIANLNFSTHKKSIAIYVSPVFEKVLYLDIPVEEKITIDGSFEIRDLVHNKKQSPEYLVLVMSGKESKLYRGHAGRLVKMVAYGPASVHAFVNDAPQRVSHFSDMSDRKETVLHKFLHQVDVSLGIILNAYHLPVFVLGPEKTVGHFKSLSKHENAIVEYIHGNYDDATVNELVSLLQPYLVKWDQHRQKGMLNLLEHAADNKKLAVGIRNVWREAANAKGRLLLIEKDYMYTAQKGGNKPVIYMPGKPYNKFSPVKDALDDVIEKVLESGGDVEFVDKDLLKNYQHIALVQYY